MEKNAGCQYRGIMRLWWCSLIVAGAVAARAVMFKDTGDPSYNTNAPTGALTDSGWQYQGQWNRPYPGYHFLGTAIAPRYFITAKHVRDSTNNTFRLDGRDYRPVQYAECPDADLAVWQVAETLPRYAPLYLGTNEVGGGCVVFGRGTQRGSPVVVGGQTNGWRWGSFDGITRWGENIVAGLAVITNQFGTSAVLRVAFDAAGNSNECHLSVGDSGGGLFIQEDGVWKLAGIHVDVDGMFSNAVDGTVFNAALLDKAGLWEGGGASWVYHAASEPSAFYSVRISAYAGWINSVIDSLTGDDFGITGVLVTNGDTVISFRTRSNQVYRVEYQDSLTAGNWMPLTNGVVGLGSVMTITDSGGATNGASRFYRVGFQ